jgi:hypothetical protein
MEQTNPYWAVKQVSAHFKGLVSETVFFDQITIILEFDNRDNMYLCVENYGTQF